jgi:hypothetical protein
MRMANARGVGHELERGSTWELTEMPSCESKDTTHDRHEDLGQLVSFRCLSPGGAVRHT